MNEVILQVQEEVKIDRFRLKKDRDDTLQQVNDATTSKYKKKLKTCLHDPMFLEIISSIHRTSLANCLDMVRIIQTYNDQNKHKNIQTTTPTNKNETTVTLV